MFLEWVLGEYEIASSNRRPEPEFVSTVPLFLSGGVHDIETEDNSLRTRKAVGSVKLCMRAQKGGMLAGK